MKTILIYPIVLIIGICITNIKIDIPETNDIKSMQPKNENFEAFFGDFSSNPSFQISRIHFPFMFIHLNEEYTKRDTSFINQNKWVFVQFYLDNNEQYSQIYDNFDHKLRDTDERVFAWHGIGNGIEEYFYFKRINGLWFLIKEEDLST